MIQRTSALILSALLFAAPFAEAAPAPCWNGDADYPLAAEEGSAAWYLHRSSARIAANDASALVFSVDVFVVDMENDPASSEFHRWWFRKPQSEDPYTVYMRQGDGGEWSPLLLTSEDAEDRRAARLFLTGWEAATGFPYGVSLPAETE